MPKSVPPPSTIAFAPTKAMRDSADIPALAAADLKLAPLPVGLALTAVDREGANPRPIPVFYMSPAAAALRAEGAHPRNGQGVTAGWYACAAPGRFKITAQPIVSPRKSHGGTVAADVRMNGEMCMRAFHWTLKELRASNCGVLSSWGTPAGAKGGTLQMAEQSLIIQKVACGDKDGASSMGSVTLLVGSCVRIHHFKEPPDEAGKSTEPSEALKVQKDVKK